jgi:hypothetical protein
MNMMINPHRAMQQPHIGEMKPLPKELVDALRAEFRRLIEDEKFMENLTTLERLASHARDLAMTLGVPDAVVRGPRGGAQVAMGGFYDTAQGTQGNSTFSMNPSGNPEQFGARAIRELVGLAPDIASRIGKALRQTPASVVDAITKAKAEGLTELAAKLEAKLLDAIGGGEDDTPAPEPPHEHTNGVAIEAQP